VSILEQSIGVSQLSFSSYSIPSTFERIEEIVELCLDYSITRTLSDLTGSFPSLLSSFSFFLLPFLLSSFFFLLSYFSSFLLPSLPSSLYSLCPPVNDNEKPTKI